MHGRPVRRDPRLKGWDYGQGGVYFITFCTAGMRPILSSISPAGALLAPHVTLMPQGDVVDRYIRGLEGFYPWLRLEHYVVMPNHVHLLLAVTGGASGTPPPTATAAGADLVGAGLPDRPPNRANQRIPALISTLKRLTGRACGLRLWQRGYYDHIVRDGDDFLRIWTYIESNPQKWELDRYYTER